MTLDIIGRRAFPPPLNLGQDLVIQAAVSVLDNPNAADDQVELVVAERRPTIRSFSSHGLDIIGTRAPSFLRSPSTESAESLNPPIHAVAQNRSGNQSTLLGAPKTRIERSNQTAETAETTRASDDGLTTCAPRVSS